MGSLLSSKKTTREPQDEDNRSLPVGDLIQAAQRLLEDEIVREARSILDRETERTHEGRSTVGLGKRDKRRNTEVSNITDHAIFRFILENNGRPTTKDEIFDAFCKNEEAKRVIAEKLSRMKRYDIIAVEGSSVTLKSRRHFS